MVRATGTGHPALLLCQRASLPVTPLAILLQGAGAGALYLSGEKGIFGRIPKDLRASPGSHEQLLRKTGLRFKLPVGFTRPFVCSVLQPCLAKQGKEVGPLPLPPIPACRLPARPAYQLSPPPLAPWGPGSWASVTYFTDKEPEPTGLLAMTKQTWPGVGDAAGQVPPDAEPRGESGRREEGGRRGEEQGRKMKEAGRRRKQKKKEEEEKG